MLNKKFVVSLFLIALFVISMYSTYSFSYAQTTNIQYEKINPDNRLLFKIKRLSEKIEGTIIFNLIKGKKVSYLTKLTNRRLAEFTYVVEKSKRSHLENASSRYITYIGLLSEELVTNANEKDTVINNLNDHPKVLIYLRDEFPAQTAEWRFVQQAVESTEVLLSKLNE